MPMLMGSKMALKTSEMENNSIFWGVPVCLILHLSSPSLLNILSHPIISSLSPTTTTTAIRLEVVVVVVVEEEVVEEAVDDDNNHHHHHRYLKKQ